MNGECSAIGWIAEQTSWTKPGSVSSNESAPPPSVSCSSCTTTSSPARASAIAAAEPVRPRADHDGLHLRARSAGRQRLAAAEHGLVEVAMPLDPLSASALPKSLGRTSAVSSSQRSGVETGAPGRGRTE